MLALGFGLVIAAMPASQAAALSTSGEIKQARATDREIVTEHGVLQSPLLNAWVDRVAAADWRFAGRKDVPYTVKILDASDVNAFTTGGGFIYVNAGTLDYVTSDDELAGVIGHETGHNERRHPITLRQRGELLSILFGVAAIFAPITMALGTVAQAGMMAHASRTDEYQADQYGIMVMTSAGFDPDAMTSFMQRLGDATGGEEVDKYLADHPGIPERLKRLRGYPQLNADRRTLAMRIAQAQHDAHTSRYAIAAAQFERILKSDPKSAVSRLELGRMQVALGFPSRARQSFEMAKSLNDRAVAAAADEELHGLPYGVRFERLPPASSVAADRAMLISQRSALQRSAEYIADDIAANRSRMASIQARLTELSNLSEDLAGMHDDGQSETSAPHELKRLGRAVNATVERISTVLGGTGSLARGRETGVLADASAVIGQTATLVAGDTIVPASISRVRAIPTIVDAVASTRRELLTSIEDTTAALLQLNAGLDQLQRFMMTLKTMRGEDLDVASVPALREQAARTTTALAQALATGDDAAAAFNRARALTLQSRITLLGVDTTPGGELAFRRAIARRCGIEPPAAARLTPGELATATVLAAEKQRRPDDLVLAAETRHEPLITAQNAKQTDALALEIFLGLIYLDYADELPKAATG